MLKIFYALQLLLIINICYTNQVSLKFIDFIKQIDINNTIQFDISTQDIELTRKKEYDNGYSHIYSSLEFLTLQNNFDETQQQLNEQNIKNFYGQFLNQAKFLYEFLHVDLSIYEKFNYKQLGNKTKFQNLQYYSRKKYKEKQSNIKFWFFTELKNNPIYKKLRIKINNEYRFYSEFQQAKFQNEFRGNFFGNRIANCQNDFNIENGFKKIQNQLQQKQIQIDDYEKSFYIKFFYNSELKVSFIFVVIFSDDEQKVKNSKKQFIENLSLLQMSKQMLNPLGYIGRYNNQDKCYYDIGFKNATSKNLQIQYLLRINQMSQSSSFNNDYYLNILNNCQRTSDTIFTYDYLGQRNTKFDIKMRFANNRQDYILKGFEDQDNINYVVSYDRNSSAFMSSDIYKKSLEILNQKNYEFQKCFYHNDDYFIKLNIKEIYLIVFQVKKKQQSKNIIMQAIDQIKNKTQGVQQRNTNIKQSPQKILQTQKLQTQVNQVQTSKRKTQNNKIEIRSVLQSQEYIQIKQELKIEIKNELMKDLQNYIDNKIHIQII